MNVRLHVTLGYFLQLIYWLVGIFTCGGWLLIQLWQEVTESRVILVAAGVGIAALIVTWFVAPIECVRDGCPGRMRRSEERTSFWAIKASYRCDDCGTVYQVNLFNPNIQISSGDY